MYFLVVIGYLLTLINAQLLQSNYSVIDIHGRSHVYYRGTVECENGRVQHHGISYADILYRDDCGTHFYRAYVQVWVGHSRNDDSCEGIAEIRENGYDSNHGVFEMKQFVDRRDKSIPIYFTFKNVCEMGDFIKITDVSNTPEEKRSDHFKIYKNGTITRTVKFRL
uniref:ZP domain-containing protein n=1 Tax=Panagrolaimus sp. PS1159 TaxID=55785 RepID=A0AC35GET5_9BILA